jgi:hypothetical protein
MSQEGKRELIRWRVQRMRCWFKAMLAHFDDFVAATLARVIVRGSGLIACQMKPARRSRR